MKIAGAYWRAIPERMLAYLWYGLGDKKALKAYLHRLQEAEKRDHRKLGKALDLFHTRKRRRGWCSGMTRAGRSISRSNSTSGKIALSRVW